MIKLLSSFYFSTFNFEFFLIAFINNAQNSLNSPLNSSSWSFVSAMKNLEPNIICWLLISANLPSYFWIAHIIFRVFFRIHKDQTSKSNDLKHKSKVLFEFRVYMKIFLWSFLFLMLEIFLQFGGNQNSQYFNVFSNPCNWNIMINNVSLYCNFYTFCQIKI